MAHSGFDSAVSAAVAPQELLDTAPEHRARGFSWAHSYLWLAVAEFAAAVGVVGEAVGGHTWQETGDSRG